MHSITMQQPALAAGVHSRPRSIPAAAPAVCSTSGRSQTAWTAAAASATRPYSSYTHSTVPPQCITATTTFTYPGLASSSRRAGRRSHLCSAGGNAGAPGAGGGGGMLENMLAYAYALQLQQEEQARRASGASISGASVTIRDLLFHPPGVDAPLLNNINMDVPPNSLGLIIGRSGSGKTTLLQVLAGMAEQTSGAVTITSPRAAVGQPLTGQSLTGSTLEERMDRVGLVFQFPERHFLGSDVFSELTFTWPRDPAYFLQQQQLRARVAQVLAAVQLDHVDMSLPPWALSGGQQRRLALAIQLVRQPSLLLLDEPLAGLDWQARREVVELLARLKKECTLLVVSHDIREIYPLVDVAWSMKLGGAMQPLAWPPQGGLEGLTAWDAKEQ